MTEERLKEIEEFMEKGGIPIFDIGDLIQALRASEERVRELEKGLDLMLQAFDPKHPGACHQDCFDTSDGHGYEMQEHAKDTANRLLTPTERKE
jgi:hypothetical protein